VSRFKRSVGYHLTYSVVVDQDTGGTVQMSCNAPEGATATELAGLLAAMREAAWREQVATNERILTFTKFVKEERDRRVAEAREGGEKLNEDMLREEDQATAATLAQVEGKVAAAQRMLNGG